jgi:RecA-family ATPase
MSSEHNIEPLPIVRAADLSESNGANRWLIEGLWTRAAVGFIGGVPKLGKTWLGLDLALSVATGTPCLGRYAVAERGETLVYLAEDHPAEVRQRLTSLCRHRGLDVRDIPVNVITAPTLRLDLDKD